MARSISIFLTVTLLIGCAIGLRMKISNHRLRADNEVWAASIPDSDPRLQAASLARNVSSAQQRIAGHIQTLARFAPPPSPDAVARDAKLAEDSPEEKRQRVDHLLSQLIDSDALQILMRDLDPKVSPLPSRVEVEESALAGWVVLRARWSQPIGKTEYSVLRAYLGVPPSLLALLTPTIPWNVQAVRDGLRDHQIPMDLAFDWLANVPGGLEHEPPDDRGFMLSGFKGDAYGQFLRLSRRGSQYSLWSPAMHEYASSIADPRLDDLLIKMAGSNQGDTEGMEAIQSFATWRSVVHGTNLTPVSDALWKNAIFPNNRLAVSERVSAAMDVAAERSYSPKFARYRLALLGGSRGMLGSHNEVLHELEMAPYDNDAFRPVMLALQVGCRIPEKLGDARLQEITASWNDERHLARLIRMATVNERADSNHNSVQPAAIAIVRLRQMNAFAANQATRYWMTQRRWPEHMHYAFGQGDIGGEHALLTAWLCSETLPEPDALHDAIQALNFTGGLATGVALTLREPNSPLSIVPQPNQKYFLQRVTQIVKGIAGRNRHLAPAVDLEAIKP